MQLKIFDKYRPFSHKPGIELLLPNSSLSFTIFPTKIEAVDLHSGELISSIKLSLTAPVRDFTACVDCEGGYLEVWGRAKEGYFRYKIVAEENGSNGLFSLIPRKEPPSGLLFDGERRRESATTARNGAAPLEKLHLGLSKKQEWCAIEKREELKEVLPLWYALSQQVEPFACEDHPSLYTSCREAIERGAKEEIGAHFIALFQTAFTGIFSPRMVDEEYRGYPLPPFLSSTPLAILSTGGALIRRLFLRVEGAEVSILPALPVELHCGRLLNAKLGEAGEVDIEWSKKRVRRLFFRCKKESFLHFRFQKELTSCRLVAAGKRNASQYDFEQPYLFEAGESYLFDNFKK